MGCGRWVDKYVCCCTQFPPVPATAWELHKHCYLFSLILRTKCQVLLFDIILQTLNATTVFLKGVFFPHSVCTVKVWDVSSSLPINKCQSNLNKHRTCNLFCSISCTVPCYLLVTMFNASPSVLRLSQQSPTYPFSVRNPNSAATFAFLILSLKGTCYT